MRLGSQPVKKVARGSDPGRAHSALVARGVASHALATVRSYPAVESRAGGAPRRPGKRNDGMNGRGRTILGATAALMLLIGLHAGGAPPGLGLEDLVGTAHAQGAKKPAPAAQVGDQIITLEEVEQAVKPQLSKLEEQRYALLEERLELLIGERLLAQEAKKRNVSVDQLLKTEVYGKATEVSDAEVSAFVTQNRARLPQGDEAELKLKVWDYLRAQKVGERRREYIQGLRGQAKVAVYLQAPAPARVQVSADKGFVRGPADAPVTIVEFSDFQCPFCSRVTATVKQVLEKYPGKVKWVFRDYPIPSLH